VKTPGDLGTDYQPLEEGDVVKIVRSLAELRRLPAEVDDPSPVAGVQSKIALTVLPGGSFALPAPGLRVPTTQSSRSRRRATGGMRDLRKPPRSSHPELGLMSAYRRRSRLATTTRS
jgi:serine/threonine-protein kinase HipA